MVDKILQKLSEATAHLESKRLYSYNVPVTALFGINYGEPPADSHSFAFEGHRNAR